MRATKRSIHTRIVTAERACITQCSGADFPRVLQGLALEFDTIVVVNQSQSGLLRVKRMPQESVLLILFPL